MSGGLSRGSVPPETADIFDVVADLVREILGLEPEYPNQDLSGFGVDSVLELELLTALEQRFGVELSENLVSDFSSVAAIAHIVEDALRVR
jgi:acyl carrier protein